MSTHAECGEEITWVNRSDDPARFMPPLEFVGMRFVISVNPDTQISTASQMATYVAHHCDPDKVAAWRKYKERLASIEENTPNIDTGLSNWEVRKERDRAEAWEWALKFDCPRCAAPAGERCNNLSAAKKGQTAETKNPHPERLEMTE